MEWVLGKGTVPFSVEKPKSRQICEGKDASGNLGPVEILSLTLPEAFCLQLFRKALLLTLPHAKAELNHNPGRTAEEVLAGSCSGPSPGVPWREILIRSRGLKGFLSA